MIERKDLNGMYLEHSDQNHWDCLWSILPSKQKRNRKIQRKSFQGAAFASQLTETPPKIFHMNLTKETLHNLEAHFLQDC
jgi:hypothetical protein